VDASVPGGQLAPVTAELHAVAGSLHERYDAQLGPAAVDTQIQLVAEQFTHATIRSFVPLFVRRFAGEALRDRILQPDPPASRQTEWG
jgi:hypothetical protein